MALINSNLLIDSNLNIKRVNRLFNKYKSVKNHNSKKCLKYQSKLFKYLNNNHVHKEVLFSIAIEISNTLCNLNRYEEAINYLKQLITDLIEENQTDIINNDLQAVYQLLLKCYQEIGDFEQVIDFGTKLIQFNLSETNRAELYSLIGRYQIIAYFSYKKMSCLFKALSFCDEAVKIYERLNMHYTQSYTYSLYDCAEIYFYLEDYDLSIKYLEQTEQSISSTELADLLYNVYTLYGQIYHIKGYKETVIYYRNKCKEMDLAM